MARVKALRWTIGSVLQPEILAALSPQEQEFYRKYSKCVCYTLAVSACLFRALRPI